MLGRPCAVTRDSCCTSALPHHHHPSLMAVYCPWGAPAAASTHRQVGRPRTSSLQWRGDQSHEHASDSKGAGGGAKSTGTSLDLSRCLPLAPPPPRLPPPVTSEPTSLLARWCVLPPRTPVRPPSVEICCFPPIFPSACHVRLCGFWSRPSLSLLSPQAGVCLAYLQAIRQSPACPCACNGRFHSVPSAVSQASTHEGRNSNSGAELPQVRDNILDEDDLAEALAEDFSKVRSYPARVCPCPRISGLPLVSGVAGRMRL